MQTTGCSQKHDERPLSQRELEHEAQLFAFLGHAIPKPTEATLRDAVLALQMAASMTRYSAQLRKSKLLDHRDKAELRAFQYRATRCVAALGNDMEVKFSSKLDTGGTITISCPGGTTSLPLLLPSDCLSDPQLRTRKLIDDTRRQNTDSPDNAKPSGSG